MKKDNEAMKREVEEQKSLNYELQLKLDVIDEENEKLRNDLKLPNTREIVSTSEDCWTSDI